MMMGYPWMSPFFQQPKFFNYYPVSSIKCNTSIQVRIYDCLFNINAKYLLLH
jgi:hypothetical protein